jgi:hypothetical protein
MNDTIGILYELSDGRIVMTFGFNNVKKTVSYYEDGCGSQEVSFDEFNSWTPRRDLQDFPNAKDPRLPYVFDLYWDIKYMSQLRQILIGHDDEKELRELILKFGL